MKQSLATMTDVERLAYVQAQVNALEEETARTVLRQAGLPATETDVRRLVFGRHLLMTLRLREFAL